MRERRNATGRVNQVNRFLDGHQHLRHHLSPERPEESVERGRAIVCDTALDEQHRDVSPTEARRRFLNLPHAIFGQVMAAIGQFRDVIEEAFASAVADAGQCRIQLGVIGANEVPEQVNLVPRKRGRDFDPRDDFELLRGRGANFFHGSTGIVIGDCDCGETGLLCERRNLCGGELAIAFGGVEMQIGTSWASECGESATN